MLKYLPDISAQSGYFVEFISRNPGSLKPHLLPVSSIKLTCKSRLILSVSQSFLRLLLNLIVPYISTVPADRSRKRNFPINGLAFLWIERIGFL
jgi:hypothetical protein